MAKRLIELALRSESDPLRYMAPYSHDLVSTDIDEKHPLYERFNDTRTPYEQYCAGEKYIKYDDERLYSRAAREYMDYESSRYLFE